MLRPAFRFRALVAGNLRGHVFDSFGSITITIPDRIEKPVFDLIYDHNGISLSGVEHVGEFVLLGSCRSGKLPLVYLEEQQSDSI